ncbi:hypothetical protein PMZ80_008723 [Knufia obscura]|uniref:Uncharacterized protein n=1 Tax=Knufia obscura TaxID=1635080 RepID=A0ABR0RFN4_9EURO|nr:hypothetical protein PMZ80_008723 [Knufia obscura]
MAAMTTSKTETTEMATTLVGGKTGLGFLDLPTEIRVEVYSHLFEAAKLSCDTPHSTWPSCGYSVCSCLFPRHITNTCRQLRQESLPILMAATTVEVAGSLDKIVSMPECYLGAINRAVVLDAKLFSLRPFQLERLPALKVLELRNITIWCKFYDEVFLESPQADEAMIGMAYFNLSRIGKSLQELCHAPRPFKLHLCCQFVVNSLSDETVVCIGIGTVCECFANDI